MVENVFFFFFFFFFVFFFFSSPEPKAHKVSLYYSIVSIVVEPASVSPCVCASVHIFKLEYL